MSCNTATGEEAAETLAAVTNKNFMLNWDPGNAATFRQHALSRRYNLLPKDRIGHCHCKDVVRKADGKYEWAPVGGGIVDWVGQFRALKRDGFRHASASKLTGAAPERPKPPRASVLPASGRLLAKAGINC